MWEDEEFFFVKNAKIIFTTAPFLALTSAVVKLKKMSIFQMI